MSQAVETGASEAVRLATLAGHFVQQGSVHSVSPLGNGNINRTFLVTVALPVHAAAQQPTGETVDRRFVLQCINANVFRQPERVIQNMVVLTEHLKKGETEATDRAANQAANQWQTPRILPARNGENFWVDEAGEYWRAISFIEDSDVKETVESVEHAKEVGYGLAMFHRLISTIPVNKLTDTLEGFHITPSYLAHYGDVFSSWQATRQAAHNDAERPEADLTDYCLNFIEKRKVWASVLEQAKAAGELRLRPIHGDPKVNNILLNADGQAISLIDLDTLKPGLVHYDIGDCLRSGCNPLGEETEDWQSVEFDADLAKAMLQGYLSLAKDFLTEQDYAYLYDAIRLLAFELGLRFFTDYLAGNVYFRVKHPTHNLTRALVQFKLTESIEAQSESLKAIINELK